MKEEQPTHGVFGLPPFQGSSPVVGILQNKGTNLTAVDDDGDSALHYSAEQGHQAVTMLLAKAGADLEARASPLCFNPLHLVAGAGTLQ